MAIRQLSESEKGSVVGGIYMIEGQYYEFSHSVTYDLGIINGVQTYQQIDYYTLVYVGGGGDYGGYSTSQTYYDTTPGGIGGGGGGGGGGGDQGMDAFLANNPFLTNLPTELRDHFDDSSLAVSALKSLYDSGKSIVYAQNYEVSPGVTQDVPVAQYDPVSGNIYINPDALQNALSSDFNELRFLEKVFHELDHHMRAGNPVAAAAPLDDVLNKGMREVYGELFAANALSQVVAATPSLASSVYVSLFGYQGVMPDWVVENIKNGQQSNMTADQLRSAALTMINSTIGLSGGATGTYDLDGDGQRTWGELYLRTWGVTNHISDTQILGGIWTDIRDGVASGGGTGSGGTGGGGGGIRDDDGGPIQYEP